MTERTVLIPARGGSRRIPRKNVKLFRGVPTISRVIKTIRQSGVATDIVVSTDDAEIAQVSLEAGARVPFSRPAELSDAHTGARPVIQHAIHELSLGNEHILGIAYPTAVLCTVDDFRRSAQMFDDFTSQFVISVGEFRAPVQRALVENSEGELSPLDSRHTGTRSQDLAPSYHDLGQFYWGKVKDWKSSRPVVESRCRPFIMDPLRVVDIDTPDDWDRAEMIHKLLAEHDQ